MAAVQRVEKNISPPRFNKKTKEKPQQVNDLNCTLKQLKTQTFPEYNISSSLVTGGAIF